MIRKFAAALAGLVVVLALATPAAAEDVTASGSASGNAWAGMVSLNPSLPDVGCVPEGADGVQVTWTLKYVGRHTLRIRSTDPDLVRFDRDSLDSKHRTTTATSTGAPGEPVSLTVFGAVEGNSVAVSVTLPQRCASPTPSSSAPAYLPTSGSATPTASLPITGAPAMAVLLAGLAMLVAGVVGVAVSRRRRVKFEA